MIMIEMNISLTVAFNLIPGFQISDMIYLLADPYQSENKMKT